MSYQLLAVGVKRLSDNLVIFRDMEEWAEYRQWLLEGGVFEVDQTVIERWGSLERGKAEVWAATKNRRDKIEANGFDYMGHPLDSDPRAVQRINTAVQAAQAALQTSQPFQIGWTCKDEHVLQLTAIDMIGVPVALALNANALHLTARDFKNRILATTTQAELEAIELEVLAWE